MQVYKVLAGLDFSGKIFEAKAQTALGNELINKYRTFVVANPATCGTINNFLREAKAISYDSGICALVSQIMETIDANRYGWALASVCESISNSNKKGNYLQMRAVEQVEPMLEMKEDEIVSYIKSGALKNIMYVEAFRNIARSVYREQPVVECSDQYTAIHPISLIVEKEGTYYFHAAGHIFRTNESGIYEVSNKEVSNDFMVVANMLESGMCKYDDGVISMELNNRTYKVFEEDNATKCTITIGENTNSIEHIDADEILIDGKSQGDIGDLVLKDREMLGESGIVIISCTLDKISKKIVAGPEILTRGFVYVKESGELIKETEDLCREVIENDVVIGETKVDYTQIKNDIRDRLGKYFYKETECKPMIITVIQEV